MTPQPIVILGTGGNSVDILDTLHAINESAPQPKYECLGFLDDNSASQGTMVCGVPVLGSLDSAHRHAKAWFVNGIGTATNFWKKEAIIAKTGVALDRFVSLVHPSASVSRMATIGRGTVVFQNVTVTSNVRIGNHVVILPNSVVSHDDVIGDYTCIAGGVCVSGVVTVGKSCYLGSNSTIKEQTTIGDNCLIGMASVVRDDVPENSVVVGNPARFLRPTR